MKTSFALFLLPASLLAHAASPATPQAAEQFLTSLAENRSIRLLEPSTSSENVGRLKYKNANGEEVWSEVSPLEIRSIIRESQCAVMVEGKSFVSNESPRVC